MVHTEKNSFKIPSGFGRLNLLHHIMLFAILHIVLGELPNIHLKWTGEWDGEYWAPWIWGTGDAKVVVKDIQQCYVGQALVHAQ